MANDLNKVNVNGTEFNISPAGAVSDVSLCYGGTKFGSVSINDKGNVAVESLSKHVNIEAVKGIQLKPTTNIIIDTSRRKAAGNGNEAHVEVVFDDIDSSGVAGDTSYGQFKIHARSIDLRCHNHGGVAIQPCFCDHPDESVPHFENKIKFESSRIKDINTNIGEYDSVQTSDYVDEGGEGLEFGTFNNLHSSLYTKDYRFNRKGYVYAADRGTPVIAEGDTKFDYPTQGDDTKDIPVNKQRVITDASGETSTVDVSLKATWEEIVWTARQYIDGCIGGSGSGSTDKQWVIDNFASKDDISAFITGVPSPLQYITESTKHNFQIDVKDMSTYDASKMEYNYANLNLESKGTVKLAALGEETDIEQQATNNVVVTASKLKLYDVSVDASGEIVESTDMATLEAEYGLSMGTTPTVGFLTTKISKKAALESVTPQLALMMQNNFDGSTYYDSSNNIVHVPTDKSTVLYTDASCTVPYVPTASAKKADVYLPDGTLPTEEYYFVINNDSSVWFYVEINSSYQAKKEPKELTGVSIESTSYVPETEFIEMAPAEIKVVDTVNIADIFELVKHKDELLALLKS